MFRSLPLILALAACSSTPINWTKPGGTAAALEQDRKQCSYEAQLATASMAADWAYKAGYGSVFVGSCLEARGWTQG